VSPRCRGSCGSRRRDAARTSRRTGAAAAPGDGCRRRHARRNEVRPGSQDPGGLVQRAAGVGHAAQHAGQHHGVHRRIGKRQPLGEAVDHLYGDRSSLSRLERALAQVPFGLNRDQFAHRRGVVGERHPAAGADLDHPTGEPSQQLPATLGASPAFLGGAGPSLDVREQTEVHGGAADRKLAARVRDRLALLIGSRKRSRRSALVGG